MFFLSYIEFLIHLYALGGFFMELRNKIIIMWVFTGLTFVVYAQGNRITFTEKLRIQEDVKRSNLVKAVDTLPDDEYRSHLKERILRSCAESKKCSLSVIVDVSKNENGLVEKFTPGSSAGAQRLKSIFYENNKNEQYNEKIKSDFFSIKGKQWTFSNKNKDRQYEKVDIDLSSEYLSLLLSSPYVKDIKLFESSENSFFTVNNENGRFYPNQNFHVEYSDDFLKKGYFDELMVSYEATDTLKVFVKLKGEPEVLGLVKPEVRMQGIDLVEAYISELSIDKVVEKGSFYFVFEANRERAIELFKDDRVKILNDYSLYSSKIKIDIN